MTNKEFAKLLEGTTKPRTETEEKATVTNKPQSTEIYIVSYSEKAIAVYGNTRPIKETLMQMGGKFNRKLTINDQVCAGWIFPKRAEGILRSVLNL